MQRIPTDHTDALDKKTDNSLQTALCKTVPVCVCALSVLGGVRGVTDWVTEGGGGSKGVHRLNCGDSSTNRMSGLEGSNIRRNSSYNTGERCLLRSFRPGDGLFTNDYQHLHLPTCHCRRSCDFDHYSHIWIEFGQENYLQLDEPNRSRTWLLQEEA